MYIYIYEKLKLRTILLYVSKPYLKKTESEFWISPLKLIENFPPSCQYSPSNYISWYKILIGKLESLGKFEKYMTNPINFPQWIIILFFRTWGRSNLRSTTVIGNSEKIRWHRYTSKSPSQAKKINQYSFSLCFFFWFTWRRPNKAKTHPTIWL